MSHIQTSYHSNVFEPEAFARTVKRSVKELDVLKREKKIEAIVFRGVSGSAVAYPAAFFLGLNLIHIRKRSDDTHSRYAVEGLMGSVCWSNHPLQGVGRAGGHTASGVMTPASGWVRNPLVPLFSTTV